MGSMRPPFPDAISSPCLFSKNLGEPGFVNVNEKSGYFSCQDKCLRYVTIKVTLHPYLLHFIAAASQ